MKDKIFNGGLALEHYKDFIKDITLLPPKLSQDARKSGVNSVQELDLSGKSKYCICLLFQLS